MEPARISTILITAADALGNEAVNHLFDGLKDTMRQKFSDNDEILEVLEDIKEKPKSKSRQRTLRIVVEESGIVQHEVILIKIKKLESWLKENSGLPPTSDSVTQPGDIGFAQGTGAISAGEGGVAIGGNVLGDIYVGARPEALDDALDVYCQVFRAQSQQFILRGLDKKSSDSTVQGDNQLQLDQVYVNLNTTAYHERSKANEESQPFTAMEAAGTKCHVVLLGGPGSGKSTFVSYFGFCLASQRVDPKGAWREALSIWNADNFHDLIPILITVREFAQWLTPDMLEVRPAEQHLWDFICSRLKEKNLEFMSEILLKRLDQGTVYVLFDGLDEIPTPEQRQWIRGAIEMFMQRYPTTRMLVTCRVLSYEDPAVQLQGVPFFSLAPFNQHQIDTFIESWYAELHRSGQVQSLDEMTFLTGRLKEAVQRSDLQRLASNPLLLTVMALVHTHKGRLPGARALLYEETVEILLWRWEQMKTQFQAQEVGLHQFLQEADRTDVDLKRILWELAFQAHQRVSTRQNGVVDISEMDLIQAMASLHPKASLDWGKAVVETIKLRAGLLVEQVPGRFSFPHRSFQEYLAGSHIAAKSDFSLQAARLAKEVVLWREVILLAVGRLVNLNGDIDKPLALVSELCPSQMQETTDLAWRKQWLAGDALKEIKLHRVTDREHGKELLPRVQTRLVQILKQSLLSPRERTEVGNTLADVGDPRFREDACRLMDDSHLGFIRIPAGSFHMGEKGETKTIEIPYDYYILKFPVTQAQYQLFLEDDGYQFEQYWLEAKSAGMWKDEMFQGRSDQQPRNKPAQFHEPFGLSNHPVVGVTWYEALAYCRWLTDKLRVWEGTPEPLRKLLRSGADFGQPWSITLPNEPEWEKAARGVQDKRVYPWGDHPNITLANYDHTEIHATSAVGCFPDGASQFGVEEMSGNVKQWTRSVYQNEPYSNDIKQWGNREALSADKEQCRVLRGGSWDLQNHYMRCANRNKYAPYVRLNVVGFRVVVSPFSEP